MFCFRYILQVLGKCVTEEDCLARNTLNRNQTSLYNREIWFIYNGQCRSSCPEETGYNSTINSCQPCGNTCVKYCPRAELSNQILIENMKGCTHINGSLTILNLIDQRERVSLYHNLRSLRYIRDYLLVARNEVIEDLQFMPNLTEIGGQILYANKSLFAYDNRNLKKLWDSNRTVSVKITQGKLFQVFLLYKL